MTKFSYEQILNSKTKGKNLNPNLLNAIRLGNKSYIGNKVCSCGSRERYVSLSVCRPCHIKKSIRKLHVLGPTFNLKRKHIATENSPSFRKIP